jgi:hypothetical protein
MDFVCLPVRIRNETNIHELFSIVQVSAERDILTQFVDERLESFQGEIESLRYCIEHSRRTEEDLQSMREVKDSSRSEFSREMEEKTAKIQELIAEVANITANFTSSLELQQDKTHALAEAIHSGFANNATTLIEKLEEDQIETTTLASVLYESNDALQSEVSKHTDLLEDSVSKQVEIRSKILRDWNSAKQVQIAKMKKGGEKLSHVATIRKKEFNTQSAAVTEALHGLDNVHNYYKSGCEQAYLSQNSVNKRFQEDFQGDLVKERDLVRNATDDFHDRLFKQTGQLHEFWDSTYLLDTPTGATPPRKAYDFPRKLSATSPHQRILERYRTLKGKLNVQDTCSGIIHEDDEGMSDGTSSSSQSPSNSTEDFAKENKSPTESGNVSASSEDLSKAETNSMGPPPSKSVPNVPSRSNSDLSAKVRTKTLDFERSLSDTISISV